MTCKDCIHYKACKSMLEAVGYVANGDGESADMRCEEFKDKAQYIKLPYKPGTQVAVVRSVTGDYRNLYITEERIDHYRVFGDHTMMCFYDPSYLAVADHLWHRVFAGEDAVKKAKEYISEQERINNG